MRLLSGTIARTREILFAAVVAAVSSGAPALAQEGITQFTGQATVEDGDTILINGKRIHLNGSDAPEMKQTCKMPEERIQCGEEARDYLAELIRGRQVECKVRARDVFERIVADCSAGGKDLQQEMIRAGWAVAFGGGGKRYREGNNFARTNQRGIWAGEFVLPFEWRRSFRVQEITFGGQGKCLIKGNIDADGERRYYKPYERWYERTRVDSNKGEKWFCTEREAKEAGWEPAGN